MLKTLLTFSDSKTYRSSLSLCVVANTLARPSGEDSSDGKPKMSVHKKGDGGLSVPGIPAVLVDNKHKE
jgi:hypothetical protein